MLKGFFNSSRFDGVTILNDFDLNLLLTRLWKEKERGGEINRKLFITGVDNIKSDFLLEESDIYIEFTEEPRIVSLNKTKWFFRSSGVFFGEFFIIDDKNLSKKIKIREINKKSLLTKSLISKMISKIEDNSSSE